MHKQEENTDCEWRMFDRKFHSDGFSVSIFMLCQGQPTSPHKCKECMA